MASGENVTPGYWGDAEETRRYFRDGNLYTGDLAQVDADGFLFIVERARDFIKAMGHRVGPEGESRKSWPKCPRLSRRRSSARPTRSGAKWCGRSSSPPRPGQLTPDDVQRYCLKRLPNYKVPQQVEFLPALPKMGNGKVDRQVAEMPSQMTADPRRSADRRAAMTAWPRPQ